MRIVDLFSGAGGLTFGFYYRMQDGKFVKNLDNEFVFANEFDSHAAKAFEKNYPDINMINCDIKKLEEKHPFVAVADMTTMHYNLLEKGKRYRDMTGNNVNHPNDFLARIYAQVILKTILD